MGREIMRVRENFDWPIGKIWPGRMISICGDIEKYFGHETSSERCRLCRQYADLSGFKLKLFGCPDFPFSDPPKGPWYQLWETVTEGSPMSPAFATPEELAHWLADNAVSAGAEMTSPYETWLSFIKGPGWAPSLIIKNGVMRSGVEVVAAIAKAKGEAS